MTQTMLNADFHAGVATALRAGFRDTCVTVLTDEIVDTLIAAVVDDIHSMCGPGDCTSKVVYLSDRDMDYGAEVYRLSYTEELLRANVTTEWEESAPATEGTTPEELLAAHIRDDLLRAVYVCLGDYFTEHHGFDPLDDPVTLI